MGRNGSNRFVTSKLPLPIEPESLQLGVITEGENFGDPIRVQGPEPNPQRFQSLRRACQKLPLWAGNRARHDLILGFPIKCFGLPAVICVVRGGNREDALVDPEVTQLG